MGLQGAISALLSSVFIIQSINTNKGSYMKSNLVYLLTLTLFCSCKKSNEGLSFPEDRVYVGAWASYSDTTAMSLSAVGHLKKTDMIMPPKHAAYSSFGSDPIGVTIYYYSPERNFKGTDTVMFKSFEPSINKTIVSTYWIKIRG